MESNELRYYTTGGLANVLQIALCFFATFAGLFININNALLALILIIAEVVIWAICGFRLAMGTRLSSALKIVVGLFIALFPILFYTVIAMAISGGMDTDTQGWSEFFFIGGPLLFFNRPAAIMVNLFKGEAYKLFAANYAIIGISYLAGGLFGYAVSAPGEKNREKRAKKEEKKREKAEKKKKKKGDKKKNKKNDSADIKEDVNLAESEVKAEEAAEEVSDYTDVSRKEVEKVTSKEGDAIPEVEELKNM